MAGPLFSLVVPTWNRAALLMDALHSLQAQTFADWECIVVDDGSTDDTRQRVEVLMQTDSRVRYLWQENAERGAARNAGTAAATGQYVYYLDSDDLLLPEALALAARELKRRGWPELLFTPWEEQDLTTGEVMPQPLERFRFDREDLRCVFYYGSCLFVKREVALTYGYSADRAFTYDEDAWWVLRLAARWPVHLLPATVRRVRLHPGQMMAQVTPEALSYGEAQLLRLLKTDAALRKHNYLRRWVRFRGAVLRGQTWQKRGARGQARREWLRALWAQPLLAVRPSILKLLA